MTFEEWWKQCMDFDEEGMGLAFLAWQKAFRAGQEDMRERAARTCAEAWKETLTGGCRASWNSAVNSCVADIRALEIKGEGE